jgi:diaminopimelate decarboxylase
MTTTEFQVQGIPVSELAREFGTPLYVYDADSLRGVYQQLRELMHPSVDIFFSLKANPNVSICSYFGSLGTGAEVSSMAELKTVQWAGIAPQKTIFLGPGKNASELHACVEAGLRAIVCESLEEVRLLDEIAEKLGRDEVPVILRINPDFYTKGSGLAMSGKPRQFGIDIKLLRQSAGQVLNRLRRVRVQGVHVYMGTRFLQHEDLIHNTQQILTMADQLAQELGFPLKTVDFGGGFGVAYFDNEKDLDVAALTAGINEVVGPFTESYPDCRLINELGRFLTARCGTYMARVLYVKESMDEQFAVTDGGMNHHMGAVGLGGYVKRNYPIRSLSRYHELPIAKYSITGPLCTPDDVIGKRVGLPRVEPGDLLGVERSGAYGPTGSPVYFSSYGFPAEVLIHEGVAHLVRERDSWENLLSKQRLIDFTT